MKFTKIDAQCVNGFYKKVSVNNIDYYVYANADIEKDTTVLLWQSKNGRIDIAGCHYPLIKKTIILQ